MKNLYFLLLLFMGPIAMMAQNGSIEGKIVNANGQALDLVNISLKNTTKGASTSVDGTYKIENVTPGKYQLITSIVGYAAQEINLKVVANEVTQVKAIKLNSSTNSLDEVTVTGNKYKYVDNKVSSSLRQKTEISKLPQNIQVISSELLEDQFVTSIMDGVTRNVSGVTMLEHWGHFARIHMRGFRIPAFQNGFNFTDSWGPLSEDVSMIESIEFVKGPAGFMLSAGEPGGFYNVVTKKPTEESIGSVSLMAGNFDFYRAAVDVGGKLTDNGKLLYRLNGMYQTSDSHRGNEDSKRFAIAPALTYKFSDKTQVTAEAQYQQAESSIGSAYVFGRVEDGYGSLDRNFKMTDTEYPLTDINQLTANVNFNHQFSDNWSATAQFGHLTYDQIGYSAWTGGVDPATGDVFRATYKWDALSNGNYAQAFVNGEAKTGAISHTILGGIDYTNKKYYADFYEAAVDTVALDVSNPTYGNTKAPEFDRSQELKERYPNPYNGFTSTAFYLQDELGFLNDKIRLTLAGRFTALETVGRSESDTEELKTDMKFTPRVGISADLTSNITVYGLFDQSFLAESGATFGGSVFDPINANDIEGGVKTSFWNGKLRAAVSVFQIKKENILEPDPVNAFFNIQNGRNVTSKGLEFDMQGELAPGLSVLLNYANTNVEITADSNPDNIGTKQAGHAQHVNNLWLTYEFSSSSKLKGFGASLGYQYQVNRSTWAWGADNQTDLPDYFRVDSGIFWKSKKFRVQLNVNNLLNEYLYAGANYGSYLYWQSEPGINGRLAVTYNFN